MNYTELLLYISLYLSAFNVLFKTNQSAVSIFLGISTIVSYFVYCFLTLSKAKFRDPMYLFIMMSAFFVSIVLNLSQVLFASLGDLFVSLSCFVLFFCILSIDESKSQSYSINFLSKYVYFFSSILIYASYNPYTVKYTFYGEYNNEVYDLGLGNPNAVSLYFLFCIIILLIQFFSSSNIKTKIFNLILIALLIDPLHRLNSRTVLVCLIALVTFYYFFSNSSLKSLSPFIVCLPIFFVFLEFYLLNYYSDFVFLDKNLETGRYEIYSDCLNEITFFPYYYIFGNIERMQLTNMHNTTLTILMNFGIIGVFAYIIFWFKMLKSFSKNISTTIQRVSFGAMIVFVLHSSTESSLMIGGLPYCLYIIIIKKLVSGKIIA